jgi:hypothetical protein
MSVMSKIPSNKAHVHPLRKYFSIFYNPMFVFYNNPEWKRWNGYVKLRPSNGNFGLGDGLDTTIRNGKQYQNCNQGSLVEH